MAVAVITGAPSGIGFNFVKKLLLRNSFDHIIIASRTEGRGNETIEALKSSIAPAETKTKLTAFACDLSSLASVRLFAEKVAQSVEKIDLLVLNAGMSVYAFGKASQTSAEGIELTFAVNHVAHWYLAELLHPLLVSASKARIVITSSAGHEGGKVPQKGWKDVSVAGRRKGVQAYYDSKLANVLQAYEIQRRYAGQGITANVLHPGAIRETNIWHTQKGWAATFAIDWVLFPMLRLMGKSHTVDQGGDALMLSADAEEGGKYLNVDKWIASSALSNDAKVSADLWSYTEQLVKEKLGADALKIPNK